MRSQWTSLDNQTDNALKLLFYLDFSKNLLFFLWPHKRMKASFWWRVQSWFLKNNCFLKLWDLTLRQPCFLFLKSAVNYLSNKWSTISKLNVSQNVWTPFFTKIIEVIKILIQHCVLRVTLNSKKFSITSSFHQGIR